MNRALRRAGITGAAGLLALALTGCGFQGLYSVPLPGGADLGDRPYEVSAEFTDVLDLVPQAAVKVGNVPVGRVDGIALGPDDRTAIVTMSVNGDVNLPANATASILQTSLLGEKYVDLSTPSDTAANGRLADGDRIPLSRTGEGVEVEQIFGALALLLNGGGLEQIQTITEELGTATDGKTEQYRELFEQLDATVGQLNSRRSAITTALDAVNELATNLRADNTQITRVLTRLSPGLATFSRQREQFTAMLTALNNLSTVTVSTLNQSKDQIVADLNALAPTLSQLAAAGTALPESLQVLLTYPFPDAVLRAIKGDYLNGFIVLNLQRPFTGNEVSTMATSGTASGNGVSGVTNWNTDWGTTPADPPPSLLPPTSSASPGLPSSTVVTGPPTSGAPSASGSASSSPSGTTTGNPTTSAPAPGGGTSGSASPSASTPGSSTAGTPTAGTATPRTSSSSTGTPTRGRTGR